MFLKFLLWANFLVLHSYAYLFKNRSLYSFTQFNIDL